MRPTYILIDGLFVHARWFVALYPAWWARRAIEADRLEAARIKHRAKKLSA